MLKNSVVEMAANISQWKREPGVAITSSGSAKKAWFSWARVVTRNQPNAR